MLLFRDGHFYHCYPRSGILLITVFLFSLSLIFQIGLIGNLQFGSVGGIITAAIALSETNLNGTIDIVIVIIILLIYFNN